MKLRTTLNLSVQVAGVVLLVLVNTGPVMSMRSSSRLAGKWLVSSSMSCDGGRKNVPPIDMCSSFGSNETLSTYFVAQSRDGRAFTFRQTTMFSVVIGRGNSPRCDANIFRGGGPGQLTFGPGEKQYVWKCLMSSWGSGYWAYGTDHRPYFWLRSEWATFRRLKGPSVARRKVYDPEGGNAYPFNLGIPAVPGTYGPKDIVQWAGGQFGNGPLPAVLRVVIVHRAR